MKEGLNIMRGRLCLSPKYLSTLSKEICGYTVQELIFKAIIQKSISLLQNTQKTIQEIADEFNFSKCLSLRDFFQEANRHFSPTLSEELISK